MTKNEIEYLSTEGTRAVEDLAKMANALGYRSRFSHLQLNNGCFVSDILNMLEDNPGMVEAMYQFILDHADSYNIEDNETEDDEEITEGTEE
jgi:hypothetical protein